MHFIYQIHFKATTTGSILHVIEQIAGIFYFGARGRINFQQINKIAGINFLAGTANAARRGGNAGFTI